MVMPNLVISYGYFWFMSRKRHESWCLRLNGMTMEVLHRATCFSFFAFTTQNIGKNCVKRAHVIVIAENCQGGMAENRQLLVIRRGQFVSCLPTR
jgi:hypothetical protein